MNRQQLLTIIAFMLIFAILFFGFDKKSQEQKNLEKSRAQRIELVNIDRMRAEAKKEQPGRILAELNRLEEEVDMASLESEKIDYLKQLASLWYQQGDILLSAYYAEEIAELENTGEAWSIAGTSYAIAGQRATDERKKLYAMQKSRLSLENAISLDPQNVDNKINLALSYVEMPSEDNPMKGILMLLDLNKEYPENINVLLQLARLAIQTNQNDKAIERLTRVLEINPELKEAHCMLYDVYMKTGNREKAELERKLCE